MRINQSNIAASNWRARADVPSSRSASAQENVQKMLEISASKRLKADDANSHASAEDISTSTSDKSDTKKTSSTYSLVNALPRSTHLQTNYTYQNPSVSRDNSSQTSGYAGRINSRLTQDAINTYRNHQFLDKREQIVSSFGVNEFA